MSRKEKTGAGRPNRSGQSIDSHPDAAHTDAAVRSTSADVENLFQEAPIGIFRSTSGGELLEVNPALSQIMGCENPKEAVEHYRDAKDGFYAEPEARDLLMRELRENGRVENFEFQARRVDGQLIWLSANARINGKTADGGFVIDGFITDISMRRQARARIEHLNRVLRSIRQINQRVVQEKDTGKLTQQICDLLVENRGYTGVMLVLTGRDKTPRKFAAAGQNPGFQTLSVALEEERMPDCCSQAFESGGVCMGGLWDNDFSDTDAMCVRLQYGGRVLGCMAVTVSAGQRYDSQVQAMFSEAAEDVAFALYTIEMEQKKQRAEQAREHAEEQLRQAQKMEAVGRLAGGVAHDFNNMLNVILGYSEIAMLRLTQDNPVYKNLLEIQAAAERSAELTHQLLAFSRKQIIEPQVMDLNKTISAQQSMLIALVGEEIRLAFQPAPDLWRICVDPTQIEQVLTNLAVNARDAIAQTGTVTVETANVSLDKSNADGLEPFAPGDYVRMRFADTGEGMEADTLAHIFEPFFTTKHRGEGSGLGLAMVYGIVKQNHGVIHAESTPGSGTAFDIYFPRYDDVGRLPEEPPQGRSERGRQTVLVVEDEAVVLDLAEMILDHYGYRVFKAGLPSKAIEIARRYKGGIALLLTDVIMPEMNGRQLKEEIEKIHPEIKTLYMSGYTDDVIARRGIINTGADLIQKPFSAGALTDKIRAILAD
ncbi:MAG: ATP-binding protein [Thermodesulfobacteriota bacterium]